MYLLSLTSEDFPFHLIEFDVVTLRWAFRAGQPFVITPLPILYSQQ